MTTRITGGVHVDRAELHHRVLDTGSGVITFGAQDGWPRVDVFFPSTADTDAVIAELVALRAEMDPPAPDLSSLERCVICDAPSRLCGHNDGTPRNVGPAPVITDSERTCDQANPGSGAWCHRGGDHGVHEDTDGQTWRTDGLRCECSHAQDEHDDADDSDAGRAPHECLRPGCGCTVFRPAAPRTHGEPPAVVNGDVVLEVRALLS